MSRNIYELPPDLPSPVDDGGTNHLEGCSIPDINLISTLGRELNLRDIFQKSSVLFIYPRAGSPLEPNTNQELWDHTPGARGCTPQSCGFRDHYRDFKKVGIEVYGLSIQSPKVQSEFVQRNEITFPVLSDCDHKLTDSLRLPTFVFEGERLIKRMALLIESGSIKKVFYPVFPPDKNAENVLRWLESRGALPEGLEISSDKNRLEIKTIHGFLKRSSWASKRTEETLIRSVENSLCFGAYIGDRQIAFARVVTDGCTFGYLCDVFVDEEFRGLGISKELMRQIMEHPQLQSYRRLVLATKDAHGLYRKYGFQEVEPDRFMEIKNDGV